MEKARQYPTLNLLFGAVFFAAHAGVLCSLLALLAVGLVIPRFIEPITALLTACFALRNGAALFYELLEQRAHIIKWEVEQQNGPRRYWTLIFLRILMMLLFLVLTVMIIEDL